MSNELFIGALSGTSMDAIDIALVEFKNNSPTLLATHTHPIPQEIRQACLNIMQTNQTTIDEICTLDVKMGQLFAEAIQQLLKKTSLKPEDIKAIGSHGQTIRHRPDLNPPFTCQIGDPNIISEITQITTIADFRRRDVAAKGQGAPLAPGFHANIFRDHNEERVILNVGGLSNITILPSNPEKPILGFDTGPGNCLSDLWTAKHFQTPFDQSGEIAESGVPFDPLLQSCLRDPYFSQPIPKSTGREVFHLPWLEKHIENSQAHQCTPTDIQATILAITAHSIAQHILKYAPETAEIFICGGGAHNAFLTEELERLTNKPVQSTEILGVPPDWVEAMLFAWLAKQTLDKKPGNCPSVTGATHEVVLGGIYQPF